MPATTSPQDLTSTLVANNVAPAKAPEIAADILKLLNDPVSKGVLIALSARAATYVVVQRTQWSAPKKWTMIALAGAAAAGDYAFARHLAIAA